MKRLWTWLREEVEIWSILNKHGRARRRADRTRVFPSGERG